MGLLRAIVITCLYHFVVTRVWMSEKNPLPETKKKEYEKMISFAIIFFVELLFDNFCEIS